MGFGASTRVLFETPVLEKYKWPWLVNYSQGRFYPGLKIEMKVRIKNSRRYV